MKRLENSNSINLAIVSPCSTCKNQQASPSPGLPVCPRRQWQAELERLKSTGEKTTNIEHLALYGTEGTTSEGDGSLRNPVYSDSLHSIIVWSALLKDNTGLVDSKGNQITTSILDPQFDTTYIVCDKLPFVPHDQEATYFQKGALSEGDQITAVKTSGSQLVIGDMSMSVLTNGYVNKVSFILNSPRKHLPQDLSPAGT